VSCGPADWGGVTLTVTWFAAGSHASQRHSEHRRACWSCSFVQAVTAWLAKVRGAWTAASLMAGIPRSLVCGTYGDAVLHLHAEIGVWVLLRALSHKSDIQPGLHYLLRPFSWMCADVAGAASAAATAVRHNRVPAQVLASLLALALAMAAPLDTQASTLSDNFPAPVSGPALAGMYSSADVFYVVLRRRIL
jgi:hypothetical protein